MGVGACSSLSQAPSCGPPAQGVQGRLGFPRGGSGWFVKLPTHVEAVLQQQPLAFQQRLLGREGGERSDRGLREVMGSDPFPRIRGGPVSCVTRRRGRTVWGGCPDDPRERRGVAGRALGLRSFRIAPLLASHPSNIGWLWGGVGFLKPTEETQRVPSPRSHTQSCTQSYVYGCKHQVDAARLKHQPPGGELLDVFLPAKSKLGPVGRRGDRVCSCQVGREGANKGRNLGTGPWVSQPGSGWWVSLAGSPGALPRTRPRVSNLTDF